MKSDAQKFVECLEDAEDMLDDYPSVNFTSIDLDLKYTAPEHFDLALFEHWSEFCESETQQKPPIRIIQHLSCTGGTLISKCLAAMPNVSLLSEVNPLSLMNDVHRSGFAPSDLTYLAKQSRFPLVDELSQKIFRASIDVISEHTRQLGRYLVLREYSHSNVHVEARPELTCNIRAILENDHALLAILTVRHPVDSYLALLSNNWIQFTPATVNEYCRRYLLFIEHNDKVPLFKYEMFVDDPHTQMQLMCEALELPFSEDFQDIFDLYALSGDSGRSSNIIEKRKRRKYDEKFHAELDESANYQRLCERLNYEPSIV